jgi:hypothetical protein
VVYGWCKAIIPLVHHFNCLYKPIIHNKQGERYKHTGDKKEEGYTLEIRYRAQRERKSKLEARDKKKRLLNRLISVST